MASDKEILMQFGQELLRDTKAVIPVATGRTAGRVTLDVKDDSIELEADAYITTLIDGRAPTGSGAKSSGKTLQQSILEWINAKGITPDLKEGQDASKATIALSWAISKSIHIHGTRLYQRGGGNNIFDTVLTPSRIDALAESLASSKMAVIESQVINGLTRI